MMVDNVDSGNNAKIMAESLDRMHSDTAIVSRKHAICFVASFRQFHCNITKMI